MRLRTFSAPSMAEAMQQIRAALGDDAIIVSSHQSERGRGVQVTAAAENNGLPGEAAEEADAYASDDAPAGIAVPEDDSLFQSLIYHDVPEKLAEMLAVTSAKAGLDDIVEALASGLDRHFEFRSLQDLKRPIMLIGPPGAGKTVTLAKLAAAATLRGAPASIISTDTVRAGAAAQLSAYTDILQQPLLTADSPESFHAAILNGAGGHMLVDTPGTNPFNDEEMSDLSRFIAVSDVDPVLVLPAGLNAQNAADMAAAYSRLGCATLIATQLDGARRLGAVLSAAQGGNLAFSVVSISPSIAQGLTPLNPMSLARVLLRDPEESHECPKTGVKQA